MQARSRRPPGPDSGPRARGEQRDTDRLPLPPAPVTHLGRAPGAGTGAGRSAAPHPARAARAGGDAPREPCTRLRGSRCPHRAHPRPALTGRSRAAISPSPGVGSAALAAARGLPGVRSHPGLERRRRRARHDRPPPPRLAVPALTARVGHGRGAARCPLRARRAAAAARAARRQR